MEDKILIIAQYGIELARLWLGMVFLFHGKIKRAWLGLVSYIVLIGIAFLTDIDDLSLILLMWLFAIVGCSLTIVPKTEKKYRVIVFDVFILMYIEQLICMIVENMVNHYWNVQFDYKLEFFCSILNLLILGFIIFVSSKFRTVFLGKNYVNYINNSIIPMLVFLAIGIMFIIVELNSYMYETGNERHYFFDMILIFVSMIDIGILAVVVYYIKNTNDRLNQMLNTEQKLNQVQRNYYQVLLEKEQETRDYRHDMVNHLVCLDDLINENNLDATKEYIKRMIGRMDDIRNQSFDTGIQIVDALLSYHVGQLSEKIIFNVKGKCNKTLSISEMDLCTIFSNLIQNAVEALKDDELEEKKFFMEINAGRDYLRVKIKNSMRAEKLQYDEKGDLLTSKKNKENHGIGTSNVKEAVAKNKGKIKYDNDDKMFCVEVTLPMN